MKFLIENNVFPEMVTACIDAGIEYELVHNKTKIDSKFSCESILCSSLNIAHRLKRSGAQVWIDIHCNEYYPHIKLDYLLNKDYIILPYGELIRQNDRIFDIIDSGELFIRPNSGFKQFTGYTIPRKYWDIEIPSLKMFPNELILIAPFQKIYREWRLVISNGESSDSDPYVISGSQYIENESIIDSPNDFLPKDVHDFGLKIAQDIQDKIYPVYVLDICETNDRLKLLELNSFTCSGLYGCNLQKVIHSTINTLKGYL